MDTQPNFNFWQNEPKFHAPSGTMARPTRGDGPRLAGARRRPQADNSDVVPCYRCASGAEGNSVSFIIGNLRIRMVRIDWLRAEALDLLRESTFAGEVALALILAGCDDSWSQPVTIYAPTSPASSVGWAITHGSAPQPLQSANGEVYFDFPVCASASVCWVSYVEKPWTIPLAGKASVSLSYSITGTTPVFNNQSPGNICGGPPALSLLLHQAGDNMSGQGQYNWYRWFSWPEAQPLALGDFTVTVPLTVDKWVPVFNSTPDQNAAGFATAIANMGQIGFGLGGGCFAAHGVAITSGSARIVIRGMSAQ